MPTASHPRDGSATGGGYRRRVRRDWLPVGAALLALAVAAVAAIVLPRPPNPSGPTAVDAFLDAWSRSRQGTYVVASTFRRELNGGRHIDAKTLVAQRPPDRLTAGLGNAEGTVDGKVVRCGSAPDGRFGCQSTPGAPDYDQQVASELRDLRTYVTGSPSLYRVTRAGPGCFDLDQSGGYPVLPYGHRATFCFDKDTGAPTLVEIHRDGSVDTTKATAVRADVSDRDFQIPPAAGAIPEPSG
jgi:hypothetical protein